MRSELNGIKLVPYIFHKTFIIILTVVVLMFDDPGCIDVLQ